MSSDEISSGELSGKESEHVENTPQGSETPARNSAVESDDNETSELPALSNNSSPDLESNVGSHDEHTSAEENEAKLLAASEESDIDEVEEKLHQSNNASENDENDDTLEKNEESREKSAHFALGSDNDRSSSPPSERQPSPSRRNAYLSSSDDNESKDDSEDGGRGDGDDGGLKDIDLSESDTDQANEELNEDNIVGPRLYPDPDNVTDDEDQRTEPTIVEVNTARICPNFNDKGLYFVKFANFLSIDTRPFDQEHYEDEYDEDDLMDEEGRARLKLRVENTIRWRYALDEEENIVKQSNSKLVQWSDGTMSLYLGSEPFDMQIQPMQQDNHLFMRQGAGLQGHAVFTNKLIFRPHSTDSITHRKMTLSMADRSNKSQKVKVLNAVGNDPESQKAEMVRKEEERLRAQHRREAQQRRTRMRPAARGVVGGLSTNFLEEREEDSDESVSTIKKQYRNLYDDQPLIGHSDSEDSDSRKLHDAKRDEEYSDSDQEMKRQKKKKVIIDDDED